MCGAVWSQLADWNRELTHVAGQVRQSESNAAKLLLATDQSVAGLPRNDVPVDIKAKAPADALPTNHVMEAFE